mmetsp:Transcript_2753/g.8345  ORF Transcript_2753/g.8345 Transcript_2753/m.8345 type:complete len:206 (-) Transcript_2753:2192-2809(-)
MTFTKSSLLNFNGASEELLGAIVLPPDLQELSEVSKPKSGVGMLGSEGHFDPVRTLVNRFRFIVLPLNMIDPGEGNKRRSEVRILLPHAALECRDGAFVEPLHVVVAAMDTQQFRELAEIKRHLHTVRAERTRVDGDGALKEIFRFFVFALKLQYHCETRVRRRDVRMVLALRRLSNFERAFVVFEGVSQLALRETVRSESSDRT